MINNKVTKKEYEKLQESSEVSILQSWEWGEIKKDNWKPLRLIIQNFPVTVLVRTLPIISKKFGYIPRGFSNNIITREFISEFLQQVKKENLAFIIIDPNFFEKKGNILKNANFESTNQTIQPHKIYRPNYTNLSVIV